MQALKLLCGLLVCVVDSQEHIRKGNMASVSRETDMYG
jgi:hypothetical protein